MTLVLGISAFYHDSAAALVDERGIVAAAQEERFTRAKFDASFPGQSIGYCLSEAGATLDDVDHVVFYDKPLLKFDRLIETYLTFAPRGYRTFRRAMPVWLREKLFQKHLLARELAALGASRDWEASLLFAEHHQSHAASAFFPSPFDEAVVLTLDGVGEWATSSAGIGRGNDLNLLKEIRFPHSLGLLYSAFTYYLGFRVNSDEYKVMGLAPYGEPRFASLILDELIDLKEDGSFALDLSYFDYCTGWRMTNEKFHEFLGGAPREPGGPITSRDMDLAASIQRVTEEAVLRLARSLTREFDCRNLCLAGGVALNCVANGAILRDGCVDGLWIQPAAGDAGGALGAALCGYHVHAQKPRHRNGAGDGMRGCLLGPEFPQGEIEARLAAAGAIFQVLDDEALVRATVDALVDARVVGWFQGRMEYGPRALGARSILADPRVPDMRERVNRTIKRRESFRPFAPSVLSEDVSDWFELACESPYMLLVADLARGRRLEPTSETGAAEGAPLSEIPAVTHVDESARVQTVHREMNPRYHALLSGFKERTGCPVLLNTSFNVRDEPLVCTPEDAFRCFLNAEIDVLVVGNALMRADEQSPTLRDAYRRSPDGATR